MKDLGVLALLNEAEDFTRLDVTKTSYVFRSVRNESHSVSGNPPTGFGGRTDLPYLCLLLVLCSWATISLFWGEGSLGINKLG